MLMAKVPKAQIKSGRRSHRADTESQSFYVKRRKIKLKSIGPSGSSDRTVTEWARAPKCTKSTRSLSTEYGVGSGCGFQHQKQRVEVSVTSTILQPLSHSPPNQSSLSDLSLCLLQGGRGGRSRSHCAIAFSAIVHAHYPCTALSARSLK